ncbi:FAD binding domain-containing protein [uncultured Roseobacter sp.]|uniref:FAD binding domain-containing protein n=1 Tax=uncultured Roseobacter sp. TaxID=114847 RepID=UPI00262E0166|nr:FAD binding domain-containing protein [uncultured Roseobacter sp.]
MTEVQSFSTSAEAAGAQGAILGGGTLLMRQVNEAPQTVPRLIRITDPALREIRPEGDGHLIGAGVTMAQVIAHPDLGALAPVARSIGGPALRNMASVGGNLFAPHPYGDFTVALLVLEAQVLWSDGRREEIERFLSARDTARGVVTGIWVPRIAPGALRYRKVSRTRPKGVSVMSIAAYLPNGGSAPRIAFGAMGPTPLRAKAAESALQGRGLTEESVTAAGAVCLQWLSPADDALASAWYRSEVAPVHLRRCLMGET